MDIRRIKIRESTDKDFPQLIQVEKDAFGSDEEANLTQLLLADESARPVISLLAFYKEQAVGHIMFSRVIFKHKTVSPLMHILAPMAVITAYQKKGIGGIMIKAGLQKLRAIGSEIVFVLGHMDYYPRHGFIPDAEKSGFYAPYPIPAEHKNAWMVQALSEKGFNGERKNIMCCDVLNRPEYWRE